MEGKREEEIWREREREKINECKCGSHTLLLFNKIAPNAFYTDN